MSEVKQIGVDVDLLGNEAKNTRVENLAVIPPANPLTIGRLMYDTVSQRVYIDTGTQLYSLSAQFGTLLANKVLVTDANGFVSTDPNFSWNTVNGTLVVKGGSSLFTIANFTLTNPSASVVNSVYITGNGSMGMGVMPSIADKLNINGKLRVSLASGVGAGLQIDVLNAIIGGTSTPVAKLDLMGGDASRPTLYLQPQTPYTGTSTDGMAWNDNVKKSFVEQQSIGNKALVGFLSGATGDSNTVVNTVASTLITTNGYTFVIPANSLTVGKRIRINFRGRYSNTTGVPTLTFNQQIGATIINTTGAITTVNSQTNRGFKGFVEIRVDAIGVSGSINNTMQVMVASSTNALIGQLAPNITNDVINTTIANTLQMSVQWGTANALNTITFEDVTYEVLN